MDFRKEIYFYYGVVVFALANVMVFVCGIVMAILLVFSVGVTLVGMYWWQNFTIRWYQVALIVLVGLLSALVSDRAVQVNQHHVLDRVVGQEVIVVGVVSRESDIRDFNTRLTVYLQEYDIFVLVKTPFFPEYRYGDKIQLEGFLEQPEGFEGDTGRYFDYPNFLLKDGIRYVMNYPEVELLATEQGQPIIQWLLGTKQQFINQLRTILPEPHVSLLGGLLVGAKSAMGQDLLDDFRTTGVIHIVVLSGFNITLVIWFVMAMLGWMGSRASAVVGTIGIVSFAIMTGAGATVVRASLMAFLVILAKVTGNHAVVLRMLCVAGLLMLLYNPMLLLYDPSFQLSFVATLGLILVTPRIERYLQWIPNWKIAELRSLVAATLSTQIMVTPLLLWMMGTFPTYSPITNFLILATVPWVMFIGFFAGLVSFFSYGLAFVFITVTYAILTYELWVVEVFAHLPFASFEIPPFSFWWVVVAYGLYATGGYTLYLKNKE